MKQIALLLTLLSLSLNGLCAQQIVPLGGYEFLNLRQKGQPEGQTKMNCENLLPQGAVQAIAGEEVTITINVDTNGYEVGSGYTCLNCDELDFGTLESTESGFTYLANTDVEQGLDTLELAFCNPTGDDCSIIVTQVVVAQRAARTFTFPTETVSPQERMDIEVPMDELPGGTACRAFVDCGDDYLGNEQSIYFLRDIMFANDFAYVAARYAGVDQVCLRVCNELGLCDDYIYEFEIVRPNVDLPFFDDFSNEGNRPRLELWQNEDVLVNRSFAVLPPSIGVATFDGVGPRGFSYPTNGTVTGTRDFLTSAPINMGGESNQAITFYAQLRGLGDRPEINDSLRLEFLRPDGQWQNVWSTRGISSGFGNCLDTAFTAYQVEIDNQFYYDGFQFRFSNLSNETGAVDMWHLDYVKVAVSSVNPFGLEDLAFVTSPPFILNDYTAIPYRQLLAGGQGLVRSNFVASFWNHVAPAQELPITNSRFRIDELTTGTDLLPPREFAIDDLPPGLTPFVQTSIPGNVFNDFLEGLENFDEDGQYMINTIYDIGNTFTQETDPGFVTSVSANDIVTTTTILADAYAYDDGSAELGLAALAGQTIVQRYEAFTADVLRGVSIRIPRSTADVSNLTIDLVVFLGELEDGAEPDLSMTVNPIYVENFYSDSLGGFTSYAFPDSLDLPVGDFYVGWRQNGNCSTCVPIGLDRSNNVEGLRFFRNGGDWFPLVGCSTGAVMVRPLVGDSQVPITTTEELTDEKFITLFPNPATERVFLAANEQLDLRHLSWTLYNLSGSQLANGMGSNYGIDLSELAAGTYFLRIVDTISGRLSRHKVVVQ